MVIDALYNKEKCLILSGQFDPKFKAGDKQEMIQNECRMVQATHEIRIKDDMNSKTTLVMGVYLLLSLEFLMR